MSRRSADNSDRKSSFLGLYVTPQTKKRVKRTAKREGVSISEAVRRRLNDIEDPAGKAHATT